MYVELVSEVIAKFMLVEDLRGLRCQEAVIDVVFYFIPYQTNRHYSDIA
jgi:hypothetical protein